MKPVIVVPQPAFKHVPENSSAFGLLVLAVLVLVLLWKK